MNNKPVQTALILMVTVILVASCIGLFPGAVDKTLSFNDYHRNKTVTVEERKKFVYQ